MSRLKVGQEKTYRIQKDAMAEFGNLKGCRRGAYTINDKAVIWFPNLIKAETCEFEALYGDYIDGDAIVEIAPDDKRLNRVIKGMRFLRVAFGRKKGEHYKFLGLYKCDDIDKPKRKVTWRRIASEIDTKDYPAAK